MLPPPSSTFTVPSLHDDLELDCRIYYPRSSEKTSARLGRTFAVIAHPYAPLGGTFDDPVLGLAGAVLVKQGTALVTFNFRGAHGSAGRTSWSGKAELGDYVAIYGFLICCINFVTSKIRSSEEAPLENWSAPLLILGGYSYGSVITSYLPPPALVVSLFKDVQEGSAESEIKQRAEQMGRDLVAYIELHIDGTFARGRETGRSHRSVSSTSHGLAMGGYGSEAAGRRISRESSRRSLDTKNIRRSMDRTRQRVLARTRSDQDVPTPRPPISKSSCNDLDFEVAYLIISPVLPPVAGLTTMFSKPTFERNDPLTGKLVLKDKSPKDEKFGTSSTCLIYGTKDMFTSSKKVEKWAQDMSSRAGHRFCSNEIEGAGHFWTEENAPQRLQSIIATWLSTLEQYHVQQGSSRSSIRDDVSKDIIGPEM